MPVATILASVVVTICLCGSIALYILRDKQAVYSRDLPLLFFSNLMVLTHAVMMVAAHDSPDYQTWQHRCAYLVGMTISVSCTVTGVPIVYRAFLIQFYYHYSKNKFEMGEEREEKLAFFRKLSFLTERRWKFIIHLITFSASFTVAFALKFGREFVLPTSYADCFQVYLISFIVQSVPLVLCFQYLFLKFIPFKDPFGIKEELFMAVLIAAFLLSGFMICQIVDTFFFNFHPNSKFEPIYLMMAVTLSYPLISTLTPLYFTYRDHLRLKRVNSFNSVNLDVVLEHEDYLQSFKGVVAEHWCSEALLFVVEVKKYQSSTTQANLREMASHIIVEYIESGSENQININKVVERDIYEKFNSGNITSSLFDEALGDVLLQLSPILLRWRQEYTKDRASISSNPTTSNPMRMTPLKPIVS